MSGPRKSGRPQERPLKPALISAEDQAAFQAAMTDVAPLPSPNRVFPSPPSISPRPRLHRPEEQAAAADSLSDHELNDYDADEALSYLRSGMPSQTLRKLRRGHWVVQAQLDLHGMSSEEARQAVWQFIVECRQLDIRCVRIIHGKGFGSLNREPVLKRKLRNWLMQKDDVLAFCQARPADGGSGAALVLLKAA